MDSETPTKQKTTSRWWLGCAALGLTITGLVVLKNSPLIPLLEGAKVDAAHRSAKPSENNSWLHNMQLGARLMFGYGSDAKARLAYANDLLELNPSSLKGLLLRALAYEELGDSARAKTDYDQLIALESRNWVYYRQRARCEHRLSDYSAAAQDFGKAIELAPLGYEDYMESAENYRDAGLTDGALAACENALVKDVNDASAYTLRGLLDFEKGDYAFALRDLNTATTLGHDSAHVALNRCHVELALSRGERTVEDACLFLNRSKQPNVLTTKATILGALGLMLQGKDDSAVAFLNKHKNMCITAWPYPIVRYLKSEISEDQLKMSAVGPHELVQARTYSGIAHSVSSRTDKARENFTWVKNNGAHNRLEYAIACAFLDNLSHSSSKLKSAAMKNPATFFVSQNKSAKWNPDAPEENGNCGPASLSMAFRCFKKGPAAEPNISPETLIERTRVMMTRHNDVTDGTDFCDVTQGARAGGLKAARFTNFSDVDMALDRGDLVIAGGNFSAMGGYGRRIMGMDEDWPDAAHFILVMGRQGNQYIICDPSMKNPHFAITRKELQSFWDYYRGFARGGVELWSE